MMAEDITLPPGFTLDKPSSGNDVSPPPGFKLDTSAAPRSMLSDIAQGTGRGLVRGVSTVAGMPADIANLVDRASRWIVAKGAEKAGIVSPEHAQRFIDQDNELHRYLGSQGLENAAVQGIQATGVPLNEAQSVPGQYAETISSFLPAAAAMGPAGLVRYGVVAPVLSETAGQLTKGTSAEPYARAAGAILPAAPDAMRALQNLANPVARAMGSTTPQQAAAAQTLLDESRMSGRVPLASSEALNYATGNGTRWGDLQRVVEQSPEGGAIMKPFMAERPNQVDVYARHTFDETAAPGFNPYEVAPRVQEAAQGTVNAADKARTAAVNSMYRAAATDAVPEMEMSGFLSKIEGMIAKDKTGLLSPQLVKLRDAITEVAPDGSRVPITDIENLDIARKFFRDQINQPPTALDAIPKQAAGRMGSLLDELDNMMETASPDFVMGKQLYQQISRNEIDPLLRSPTGQLAATDKFQEQAQLLFSPNPLPGSEAMVGRAISDVVRSDPEAAQQLVRTKMEQVFNSAMRNNTQWGGAKFQMAVYGNPQQAKNLEAAVKALPDGAVRWNAWEKMLDIFGAMRMRQPMGSPTEFNRQINDFLKQHGVVGEVASEALSPISWGTTARRLWQRVAYAHNTAQLARIFTEGNISDLQALAKSGAPRSFRAQASLVGLLGREGALSLPEGESPQP